MNIYKCVFKILYLQHLFISQSQQEQVYSGPWISSSYVLEKQQFILFIIINLSKMNVVKVKFPMTPISCTAKETLNMSASKKYKKYDLLIEISQKEIVKTQSILRSNIAQKNQRKQILQDQIDQQIGNKRFFNHKVCSQLLTNPKPISNIFSDNDLLQQTFDKAEKRKYNLSTQADGFLTNKYLQLQESLESQFIIKTKPDNLIPYKLDYQSQTKTFNSTKINLRLPICQKHSSQEQIYTQFESELLKTRNNTIEGTNPEQSKISSFNGLKNRNLRCYIDPILFPIIDNHHRSIPRMKDTPQVPIIKSKWRDNYSPSIVSAKYCSIDKAKITQRKKIALQNTSIGKESRYRDVSNQEEIEHSIKASAIEEGKLNLIQNLTQQDEGSKIFYGDLIFTEQQFRNIGKKRISQLPEQNGFQDNQMQEMEDYFYHYVQSQKQ